MGREVKIIAWLLRFYQNIAGFYQSSGLNKEAGKLIQWYI